MSRNQIWLVTFDLRKDSGVARDCYIRQLRLAKNPVSTMARGRKWCGRDLVRNIMKISSDKELNV